MPGADLEGEDKLEEFLAVGVGGEAVHLFDVAAEGDHVAEDGDEGLVVLDFSAEGIFGLIRRGGGRCCRGRRCGA